MTNIQIFTSLFIILSLAFLLRAFGRSRKLQLINALRFDTLRALYQGDADLAARLAEELHHESSLYNDEKSVLFAHYAKMSLTGRECNLLESDEDFYLCEVNALASIARADWQHILDETDGGVSSANPFLVALRLVALAECSRWKDFEQALDKHEVMEALKKLPATFREQLLYLIRSVAGEEIPSPRWIKYADYCQRLAKAQELEGKDFDGTSAIMSSLRYRQRQLLLSQQQAQPASSEAVSVARVFLLKLGET